LKRTRPDGCGEMLVEFLRQFEVFDRAAYRAYAMDAVEYLLRLVHGCHGEAALQKWMGYSPHAAARFQDARARGYCGGDDFRLVPGR